MTYPELKIFTMVSILSVLYGSLIMFFGIFGLFHAVVLGWGTVWIILTIVYIVTGVVCIVNQITESIQDVKRHFYYKSQLKEMRMRLNELPDVWESDNEPKILKNVDGEI